MCSHFLGVCKYYWGQHGQAKLIQVLMVNVDTTMMPRVAEGCNPANINILAAAPKNESI
jgi:hypothetical protein